MAMGQQKDRQGDLMVGWSEMLRSPGHVFYDRLQSVLVEADFDAFVEATCKPYYAARMAAPSVPPGRYFRMHLVGYFEGIDSEGGLEWRCSDSLSLREFLRLANLCEPAPNPDSRVMLSDQKDALGQRRARLDWRLSPLDKRTIRRAQQIIGEELERAGIGRIETEPMGEDDTDWPEDLGWGWHHMSTTRMHDDPKKGVVDRNCRVHGISNLCVAGSSVFATGGNDLPTMSIVALALRLADHLKAAIAGNAASS